MLETGKQYYSVYQKQEVNLERKLNVIFQGDSWGELLDRFNVFSNLILERADNFINGGTSSYSPSLMEIQLRDIIEETKIIPKIIIAYIDQTDFMDEVCDYSKRRIEHDGELLAVLKASGIIYECYPPDFMFTKLATGVPKLLFFIENRLHSLSINKAAKSSKMLCKFGDIAQFMESEIKQFEKEIFFHSLNSYLNYATKVADRVILVTHKHRKHYEKIYKNDIYKIVSQGVNQNFKDENIEVMDISPVKIEDLDEVFPSHQQDPASHPHMTYYENYIAKEIFDLVFGSDS